MARTLLYVKYTMLSGTWYLSRPSTAKTIESTLAQEINYFSYPLLPLLSLG